MHKFENAPYTVFGTNPIPQVYAITMRVGGLLEMLQGMEAEDTFQIAIHADGRVEYFSSKPNAANEPRSDSK